MIIPTRSGKLVNILNPEVETICIEDIALGLSREGRFANQGKFHYSVAQHSVYFCGLMPDNFKLEGLLHDATEAYIKDIPYGMKMLLISKFKNQVDYRFLELWLQRTINKKFQLRSNHIDTNAVWDGSNGEVYNELEKMMHVIDIRLAITEAKHLFDNHDWIYNGKYKDFKPYDFPILPMTFEQVFSKFMGMFEMYRRDK